MKRYILSQKGGANVESCEGFPQLPHVMDLTTEEYSNIKRIISIGDLHGDLRLAVESLEAGKLIERVYTEDNDTVKLWYRDEKEQRIYKWIAKDTVAVQVGDQVDRCRPFQHECHVPEATINDENSDTTIMFFYHDLHMVARNHGSHLISLLGNHELLNVLGSMRYVSYKGLKEFETSGKLDEGRIDAFKISSNRLYYNNKFNLSQFMACSRLTSVIVGGYLFVHAGIMEKLIEHVNKTHEAVNTESVAIINNLVQKWLLNRDLDKSEKDLVRKILSGRNMSPYWPRVFGSMKMGLDKEDQRCKKYVEPVLTLLSLKGIVVGHTPQIKTNINSTCSNTVWRVDIAGSQAFDEVMFTDTKSDDDKKAIQLGRKSQVLEITVNRDGQDTFKILKHGEK